jgi:hypothetical protein
VKCLPDNGLSETELSSKLKEISMGDMDMFAGRMFDHAFFTGDDARRAERKSGEGRLGGPENNRRVNLFRKGKVDILFGHCTCANFRPK